MAELGVGYISIIPETSKITPGIAKALGSAEPAADKSGKSMGGKLASGMGTALKGAALGVGVAAGAAVATGLTKGMGRLTGIENAEAKLRGLGHSAGNVGNIMDDALVSVRGTAFGLEDAATVAASAVAAGIQPGQDLQRTLKLMGDSATIAGTDLSSMGSIINKVATSDMMQMDVANQLMDAGIPILQMVAAEMGVTADEARKLASEGSVSFATFQAALEKGVGGAALESGNTVQGAFANMGAAAGRLGATIQGPFYRQAAAGFGGVTSLLDKMDAAAKPIMTEFEQWLTGTAVPGFKAFGDSAKVAFNEFRNSAQVQTLIAQTGLVVGDLVDAGKDLGPVFVTAGSAVAKASAALGVSSWQLFLTALEGVGVAAKVITPPLQAIADFMDSHPGAVTAAVAAWTGFKVVPGVVEKLSGSVGAVRTALAPAASNVKIFGSSLREAYMYAGQANPQMGALGKTLTVLGGQGGVASVAMGGLKSAAGGLLNMFGGPWGAALVAAGVVVNGLVQANQAAEAAQDAMAEAARDSAEAQIELREAAAGTTGVLNEQGLAAAARIAKGELSELVEVGGASRGWLGDMALSLEGVDQALAKTVFRFNDSAQVLADQETHAAGLRDQYKALESAADELGYPMEDINRIVAEGGTEYLNLITHLRGTGEAGEQAAAQLESARAELDRMVEDARRLEPAVAEAAAAIDVLADSSSTADQKLGGLQRMLQAMGLAPKDAEQAMWDAAEATDELVSSLEGVQRPAEGMGDALFDAAGELDKNNEHARELRGELLGLAGELQNVGVNGGDVHAAFADMDPALQALADSFGLSKERVMELGRELGLVPNEIAVGVSMEGLDEAGQSLATLWTQMQQIPPGQSVEFTALTQEAEDALTRVGFKVEDIPNSDNVNITATTEDAQAKLDTVFKQMTQMDGISVSPTVLLDTMPLITNASNAQQILDALDIQTPTPEADIIIQKLLDGVTVSQGELDFLASQSPTPVADLNKQLLEQGVSVSNEMLTALQNRKPTPQLDADGRPLFAAVDSSKAKLDELQDKTVSIRIQEWREYYSTGRATDSSGTPVGQRYAATGGRLGPRGFARYEVGGRHDGYRLPTSGPGTERTDGFMAFDSGHAPIARLDAGEWVINGRMSERYDRELAAINAGTFPKLPGYTEGGRVSAEDLLAFARGEKVHGQQMSRSLEGAGYVFGGSNWGDCSSAQGHLALFAAGLPATGGRFMWTGDQRQQLAAIGFKPGLGPSSAFNIGWFNDNSQWGGHTSGTIAGVNVEMGGGRGNGQIGGGAAGASHPQYTDHAHLPLVPDKPVKVGEEYTEWATPGGHGGASGQGASFSPLDVGRVGDGGNPPSPQSAPPARGATGTTPTSWSEVAAIGAAAFASGMVKDTLGVFGIPDSPPALQAYAQWQDAKHDLDNNEDAQAAKGELRVAFQGGDAGYGGLATVLGERDARTAVNSVALVGSVYDDAMRAVVGDVKTPTRTPKAVVDLMRSLGVPGFNTGGTVAGMPGVDQIPALLTNREFVVNASAADRARPLLEHINAGGDVAVGGGRETHYHIHGGDTGDLMRQLEARELLATMQHLGG